MKSDRHKEPNTGTAKAPTIDQTRNDKWIKSVPTSQEVSNRSITGIALQFAQAVVGLVATMSLARILEPGDFGVLATIAPVVAFASMLKDFGISISIVQSPTLEQIEVTTYFWLQVLLGLVLGGVVALSGPVLASFFEDERMIVIAIPMGLVLSVGVIGNVHNALLRRNLLFKQITVVQIVSTVAGVVVAIIAGFVGLGYWALIAQQFVLALVSLIGLWIACQWRPGAIKIHQSALRGLIFGGTLTLGRLCDYIRGNADMVLIRKFTDEVQLGYYGQTQRMIMIPTHKLMGPVMSVALPMLSRLQGKPDYPERFEDVFRFCIAAAVPVGVFAYFFPLAAVRLLLGEQWVDTVPIMRGLAIAAIVWPVGNCLSINLVVFRQVKILTFVPLISMSLAVVAFSIGIQHSVARLAEYYGWVAATMIPIYSIAVVRNTPLSGRRLLLVALPAVVCMIIATAVTWGIDRNWGAELPVLNRSFLQAGVFGFAYLVPLLFFAGYLARLKMLLAHFGGHKNILRV